MGHPICNETALVMIVYLNVFALLSLLPKLRQRWLNGA